MNDWSSAIDDDSDFSSLLDDDEETLSDYELGFLRGVLAARGLSQPTEDEFREAMQLLQLHSAESSGEHN